MKDVICHNCGSVNDYHVVKKSNQETAYCNSCELYIKNLPQGGEPTLYFGKYTGRTIVSMVSEEELRYLNWLLTSPNTKNNLRSQIENHLNTLK